MADRCTIVGILDDGWAGLGATAQKKLATADCVIGARRTLDLVARHLSPSASRLDMDGKLGSVVGWIREAGARRQTVAVLATGDPLCHGVADFVAGQLGREAVDILPAPSTIQLAFARLKRSWADARVMSVHGPDAGEWDWGATPKHGLYALVRAVAENDCIACLTSPANGPDRIARALLAAGFGEEFRISVVARLQLPEEQIFASLSLQEAATRKFPDPNVVVLERFGSPRHDPLMGFEDGDYAQRQPRGSGEGGLITKLEMRAVSLAKLHLTSQSIVWDIGAGSGSVGLEAARLARLGHVYAIEKNAVDADIARRNARRMGVTNYTLIESKAPNGLEHWPDPDAVFLGGTGGELSEIIKLCLARLQPHGRLVMNFVTLENLATAQATLAAVGARWDAVQLSAARSEPILDMHRFAALNPVWIVSVDKPVAERAQ